MSHLVSGASDIQQALKLRDQFLAKIRSGRFELRKWVSNSSQFLNGLSIALCESDPVNVCALGINWNPH